METEIFIPKDSPVRLLNAVVERMDLRNIMRSYSRIGRIEYPPRILLKMQIPGERRSHSEMNGVHIPTQTA
jgi:transposase